MGSIDDRDISVAESGTGTDNRTDLNPPDRANGGVMARPDDRRTQRESHAALDGDPSLAYVSESEHAYQVRTETGGHIGFPGGDGRWMGRRAVEFLRS